MIDHGERKLEDLLSSRHVEPASADLSQRIILKARALPQKKTLPLWRMVGELFSEFHLPQPAYVMAAALLAGVVIGFSTPPTMSLTPDDGGVSIQSLLAADESLL
jgi:hypothetical protein